MNKINKKTVLMVLIIVGLFVLSGCQRNVDANGVTLPEKVIALSTSWSNAMNEGVLSALLVWPLAQLINLVNSVVNSPVISIVVVTILYNLITLPLSIKSTVSTQKLQIIQPELLKIQAKYEGKTDDNSKLRQAQEMQALYSKNGISPLGSMIMPFIQLPVLISMYYAVQRSEAVVNGTFASLPMITTPKAAIANISKGWPLVLIFVLMCVSQFISSKVPMWLADKKRKATNKYKAYAQPENNTQSQQNIMMISMIAMVGVIGLGWPIAMSIYWLISSIANIGKTLFIQWRYIDHE